MPLAEVILACGRTCLKVAGIVLAVEGDPCRSTSIPEPVLPPIPREELENATIGGQPIKGMSRQLIGFFRGDNWTPAMLEWVAARINEVAG